MNAAFRGKWAFGWKAQAPDNLLTVLFSLFSLIFQKEMLYKGPETWSRLRISIRKFPDLRVNGSRTGDWERGLNFFPSLLVTWAWPGSKGTVIYILGGFYSLGDSRQSRQVLEEPWSPWSVCKPCGVETMSTRRCRAHSQPRTQACWNAGEMRLLAELDNSGGGWCGEHKLWSHIRISTSVLPGIS